jgi:hypothetical protein
VDSVVFGPMIRRALLTVANEIPLRERFKISYPFRHFEHLMVLFFGNAQEN